MTKQEWASIAATVNVLWPKAAWPAQTVRAAESLILDLDARAVMAAVHDLAAEGRDFPPPPGLIRKRAVELVENANGNRLPDPEEALREVYQTISRVGVYRTPQWSNPAIAHTIDALGGWEATCMDENPEAFRAHFLRLYGTCRQRVEREALMAPSVRELLGSLDLGADRELTA